MTRFYVDTDADEPYPVGLNEPTDQLTYFLSFAVAERYGAQHELSKAANLIKIKHRVDMNPILNFVDRNVEGPQERLAFERTSWQDPERLANCVRAVIEAIGADEKVRGYLAGYAEIVPRLEELFEVCLWAMENGARVRLSFEMEAGPLKEPVVIPDETGGGS
jgi:hypothetical protein